MPPTTQQNPLLDGLRPAAEAFQVQQPIEWVVDQLFSAGSVALLVGKGGSKKTWAMLDLAVCVAMGEDWLDYEVQRSPVLFLDEESGERRFSARLRQVMAAHNAPQDIPLFYRCLGGLDLTKLATVKHMEEVVRSIGAKVVIVDALADVMLGGDENSVKDTQPLFRNLRAVAEATQAAIIVIHHTNKMGDYRGSTAMHGAVDLMLQLESEVGSPSLEFSTIKARDVAPMQFAANIDFTDTDKVVITNAPAKRQALPQEQQDILDFVKVNGDSKLKDLEQALGGSAQTIRRNATALVRRGKLKRRDKGKPGCAAIFGLPQNSISDLWDLAELLSKP